MKIRLRWTLLFGVLGLLVSFKAFTKEELQPALGDVFDLSSLEPVGDFPFRANDFDQRNLLLFISTKESADQSKRWGEVIGPNFENKIARWNNDHGQKVLVIPVLDSSVDKLSYLPNWALKFLVRQLGGSDPDAVLLDYEGIIRRRFGPIPNDDSLLVLLGPHFKLQAFAIGEPTPIAQARILAALYADVGRKPQLIR